MDFTKIKEYVLNHKQYFIIGIIALGILLWVNHTNNQPADNSNVMPAKTEQKQTPEAKTTTQDTSTSNEKPKNVTCDISGAVKRSGVYTLKNGARMQELIDAAGGLRKNAQIKLVNRALILHDQDQVHIPYHGEKIKRSDIVIAAGGFNTGSDNAESAADAGADGTAGDNSSSDQKINLNTASATDLQKLNGIGEKKAQQIIAYRQKSGPFKKIEDLKQVSGIGDKTFAALKDQLAV